MEKRKNTHCSTFDSQTPRREVFQAPGDMASALHGHLKLLTLAMVGSVMFLTPYSQKCFPVADAAVINIREAQNKHDITVTSFLLSLGYLGSRPFTYTAATVTAFLGVF